MNASTLSIPAGFERLDLNVPDGYIDTIGPLYLRRQGDLLQLGFRVEPRHCNPMQICHGGMMSTFCDMLLPITATRTLDELTGQFLPTISLQVDYLAASPLGAWVQGQARVLRVTRSLVFIDGLITADETPVARTSGVFKISRKQLPTLSNP